MKARPLLTAALGGLLGAAAPGDRLDLGQGHSLVPRARFTDPDGQTHSRYQHFYQGLRVWGQETIGHPGAPAGLEPAPAPRVEFRPSLAMADAQRALQAELGAAAVLTPLETVLLPLTLDLPAPVPGQPLNAAQVFHVTRGYALAHRIRAEGPQAMDVLVDAHSGRILRRLPLDPADLPAKGVGNTLYSRQVALDTTATASGFLLLDQTRGRGGPYGGNAVTDKDHRAGDSLGSLCFNYPDSLDVWGNGTPEPAEVRTGTATAMTVAADAAYGVQKAWDYFAKVHGRNGWDGQGSALTTRVHFLDRATDKVDNAFWSGRIQAISICDPQQFWPRSSLRTLAHEFSHAVNESTANLEYEGEAGGLNEASSDIFAAMVPAWLGNGSGARIGARGAAWTITGRRTGASGLAEDVLLRSMIKPSQGATGRSPDAWTENLGQLDPHDASGPMNRAFFFLAAGAQSWPEGDPFASPFLKDGMTGIGNDKAARIWYRALTTYLVPASNYLDARRAALRAAIDLYGAGSPENVAVRRAFGAIKVGDPYASVDDLGPPVIKATATVAGADLLLSAEASDNDRVAAILFLIDGIPVAPPGTATSLRLADVGRLLPNGPHFLQAAALDPSGNQANAIEVTFILDNPYEQVLEDPGLETRIGDGPWDVRPAEALVTASAGPGPAHGGRQYLLLGNVLGSQSATQGTTIPGDARQATLRFWARISGPAGPVSATLKVQVLGSALGQAGTLLATPLTLSNQDAWPDWVAYRCDLSGFIGRQVTIRLLAEASAEGGQFLVDDLTLVCGTVPVEAQVDPARLALRPGASATLSARVLGAADQELAWSVLEAGGGSLDAGLRYTAPASPGSFHVLATPLANPAAVAEVSIRVRPAIEADPAAAIVDPGGSARFSLTLAPGLELRAEVRERAGLAQYTAATGELLFIAPATAGTCHLDLSDRADPGATLSIPVTVVAPVAVGLKPAVRTMATGSSAPFQASLDGSASGAVRVTVLEGEAGGSLAADREDPDAGFLFYTAPATPGTYHLVASSPLDPRRIALATVTVTAQAAIDPPQVTLTPGQPYSFSLTVPGGAPAKAVWSASGGAFEDQEGGYRAPTLLGRYQIQASGAGFSASATVIVKGSDLDGDGAPGFGDLALLADDYGTVAADDPADLDGNGVVDDHDVALALAAFTPAAPVSARPAPPG
jgi:Zn-dependent metalloprotease